MTLGTLGLILFIYLIRVLFFILFWIFVKITRSKYGGNEYLQNSQKNLFFGPIISIGLEGYLELLIAGYFTLASNVRPIYAGDTFAQYLGYFSLLIALVYLPFSNLYVISKGKADLENEEFKQRWGSFYHNLKKESAWTMSFEIVFMVRRILFLTLAFGFRGKPVIFQILGI